MSQSANTAGFRGDIELLRGVAVLLVILFHLKLDLFKSGFIGVDVFFVLSGFLMGAVFKEHTLAGALDFLDRRARRVVPPAIAVFLVFHIVAAALLLPFELRSLNEAFIGTLLLSPNVSFWTHNGYFADFSFRPMLHYWSLGVEYHYYVLFPVMIIVLRARATLLFVVAVCSVSAAIWLSDLHPKSGFFLLPARIWEFLVGYFVFRLQERGFQAPRPLVAPAATACLGVLVWTATLPLPAEAYPGIYAMVPVALTACILLLKPTVDAWPLWSGYLLRKLGLISFSVYLIHYPVFSMFGYRPFLGAGKLSALEMVAAVVITLALSVLSYIYVENWFRSRSRFSTKRWLSFLAGIYVVSAASIVFQANQDYFLDSYPAELREPLIAADDIPDWRCSSWETLKAYDRALCRLSPGEAGSMLVFGDSHMNAAKNVFVEAARDRNVGVYMPKANCGPAVKSCPSATILNAAVQTNISDVVVHWFLKPHNSMELVERFLQDAVEKGIRVHVVDPVPTYKDSVPMALFNERRLSVSERDWAIDRTAVENGRPDYLTLKRRWASHANVFFYDTLSILCPDECRVDSDEGLLYHDNHHLSTVGSALLAPIAEEVVTRALSPGNK